MNGWDVTKPSRLLSAVSGERVNIRVAHSSVPTCNCTCARTSTDHACIRSQPERRSASLVEVVGFSTVCAMENRWGGQEIREDATNDAEQPSGNEEVKAAKRTIQ